MYTMNSYIFLLSCLLAVANVSGFVSPASRRSTTSLSLTAMDVPPAIIATPQSQQQQLASPSTSLNNGIGNFISNGNDESAILTSTNVLSLKDRPPPPTAEEIAAKKRTFNLWFWGGGFVAPFLATFYYFGLKFWER